MFDIWKKLILVTYGRRSRRLPERRDESEREGVGERASGRWKSFVFVRAATSRVVGEERGTLHFFTALSLSLLCPLLALRETFMATSISVRVKNRSSPLPFASQRRLTDFHGWSGLPNKHHRRSPSILELGN